MYYIKNIIKHLPGRLQKACGTPLINSIWTGTPAALSLLKYSEINNFETIILIYIKGMAIEAIVDIINPGNKI